MTFPRVSPQWCSDGAQLAADSCGGSHGFGPDWVIRTVFPFDPLDFIRRGTVSSIEAKEASPSSGGSRRLHEPLVEVAAEPAEHRPEEQARDHRRDDEAMGQGFRRGG